MSGFSSITPSININTSSGALRTELLNTFSRLDGQLSAAPYRFATQNGPVGNTGAAETDLMTFQINFNTLTNLGTSMLIFACGKTAANANTKTFKIKLGATTLFSTGAVAANDDDWTFQAEIIANGATSQIFWSQFTYDGVVTNTNVTTSSEDLGTNLAVTFTGQGTASDDISLYYFKSLLIG